MRLERGTKTQLPTIRRKIAKRKLHLSETVIWRKKKKVGQGKAGSFPPSSQTPNLPNLSLRPLGREVEAKGLAFWGTGFCFSGRTGPICPPTTQPCLTFSSHVLGAGNFLEASL